MQTPKASHTGAPPPRVSPRSVRQLKPAALEVESASSSNQVSRGPKNRSPKTVERISPRSRVPERKRPSGITELELEISRLRQELRQARNQLSSSESRKKQAQQEAESSKEQLDASTQKLEVSQKQLQELSDFKKICITKLQNISQEPNQVWKHNREDIQKQNSVDSAALVSAFDQIQGLKVQLEVIAISENAQLKQAELKNSQLQSLKGNLTETLALVDKMKNQLEDVKDEDATVQELANKTLLQLQYSKHSIEALRLDGVKAVEAYKTIASELDQSRARVNSLEELVSKLQRDLNNLSNKPSQNSDGTFQHITDRNQKSTTEDPNQLKVELCTLESEVERLTSALEEAEMKKHDMQIQSAVRIKIAHELVEQMKSESSVREAKLTAAFKETKSNVEVLKAKLMDKETELQGISEENEGLKLKLANSLFCKKDSELRKELEKYEDNVAYMNTKLMEKETKLKNILKENEVLKSEIRKREMDKGKASDEVVAEVVEAARAAEQETLVKLGIVMEEADKSNRRAARVTEQLGAAQAANTEMETELRRLKVQSDQWRKAAETAIAMLSGGDNGKFVSKTGSADSNFNCVPRNFMEDHLIKKKNGHKLRKFGVPWKKPEK